MRKVFNKLVRDNIPKIIEKENLYALTRTLSDDDYDIALSEKLLEEATEIINASDKEEITYELADLLEVMHAKAKVNGIDFSDVEEYRKRKNDIKGSFNNKTFLICSVDKKYVDENSGCLTCINESCKVTYNEKIGYEKDGKPAGYYCLGYKPYYKK